MDILDILKSVGVELTKEQEAVFKSRFYTCYKSVKELKKMQEKCKGYKQQIASYQSQCKQWHNDCTYYQLKHESVVKELVYLQNKITIEELGVAKEFSDFVQAEVLRYINVQTDFTSALVKYIKEHPQYILNPKLYKRSNTDSSHL